MVVNYPLPLKVIDFRIFWTKMGGYSSNKLTIQNTIFYGILFFAHLF